MRKEIEEYCREVGANTLFAEGFDSAIIGLVRCLNSYKVLYDTEKIISMLREETNSTKKQAREYFLINIAGSDLGEETPVFLENIKHV
jgi:hypothetical protein